ncbi:nuclear factor-related [Anaeramoeba ignava]|uniref:Nuclear factor-related n=1 Tax=Anaeramoeba ignava TaxID=1746090 RepID=A0A9Q0LV27_ANAIG|nr:nuclear factor-related [Anaeramoeba ignava]
MKSQFLSQGEKKLMVELEAKIQQETKKLKEFKHFQKHPQNIQKQNTNEQNKIITMNLNDILKKKETSKQNENDENDENDDKIQILDESSDSITPKQIQQTIDDLQFKLNKIVMRDCIICGQITLKNLYDPFFDPNDPELSSWDIKRKK